MSNTCTYDEIRGKLRDGDIVLCHSTKPIARGIQLVDNCEFHHSGIVFLSYGRVHIEDAHPGRGVHPAYFSHRMKEKKWDYFIVLRPKARKDDISRALKKAKAQAEKYIKYDLGEIFRILWWRITGYYKRKALDKFTCSEFTQYYAIQLGLESHFPGNLKRPFFTPQDHLRVMEEGDFKIISNV